MCVNSVIACEQCVNYAKLSVNYVKVIVNCVIACEQCVNRAKVCVNYVKVCLNCVMHSLCCQSVCEPL